MDGSKGHNFPSTVESRSNFYMSFRMHFSMEWMSGDDELWSIQAS
jgi:hypothetical protein